MRRIKSAKNTGSKGASRGSDYIMRRIKRDILREAKVLNKHPGAVELIADKVAEQVGKWTEGRAAVTEADLDRVTAARIRRYDADIAYVFRNRGKII